MKIAVIERCSDMREVYRNIFSSKVMVVECFNTLEPNHILENSYDVLISNLNLPYIDSLKKISELRLAKPQMPIAVVSGCISYSDEEIKDFGVNRVFRKPRDISLIQEWLMAQMKKLSSKSRHLRLVSSAKLK